MSNNAMSNETDLDWLARNVHKWQGAERCVSVCNGVIRWTVGSKPMDGLAWFTKHEWLARRAELQSVTEQFKPSIEEANMLAQEFKLFTSIEDNQEQDMKQDNGWHERGDLPPVGFFCEAYIDLPPQWIGAEIVAHKDGFAIGWCKSVMKGCHGDKASEFRPIRTERDVLADLIESHGQMSALIVADAIIAAGFKLEEK